MGVNKNKAKKIIDMDVDDIFKGIYGIAQSTLGINKSDVDVILHRKTICLSCDYIVIKKNNVFNKSKCSMCGCWLNHKVRLKDSNCPKHFW